MDIIDRKYRILQAIIDDYIMTALPVGSRTISKKYEQNLSSATIRNEMSDLEELGYLDSPHTSAGRVPSMKAYRLYVDQMLHPSQLSAEEMNYISNCFDQRVTQIETLSAKLARAISGMTHYATAVMTQSAHSDERLSHIQLVPVSERRALLILVTEKGAVKQRLLNLEHALDADTLYTLSRVLTERLSGCPMDSLQQELLSLAQEEGESVRSTLRIIADRPQEVPDDSTLVVGGRSNLLAFPEYADIGKAQELLKVLETRDKMVSLLRQNGEMEISIRIGPETGVEEMRDCSVVTASYRLRDGSVNTIGLIGPTRMQYGRAVAVLEEVGKALKRAAEGNEIEGQQADEK